VEVPEDEIEQILLTSESETLEFKEKLEKSGPEKIAKTATDFANTKGGTIVFGVDDDHRVVGCAIKGMADTITNIIRGNCDPPPEFAIRVVHHEGKDLVLVRIVESSGSVHTVKDRGPFIRANGTNRAPNSYELEALFRRRRSITDTFHGLS
jgi:predicted HTH transcriptional regulator